MKISGAELLLVACLLAGCLLAASKPTEDPKTFWEELPAYSGLRILGQVVSGDMAGAKKTVESWFDPQTAKKETERVLALLKVAKGV